MAAGLRGWRIALLDVRRADIRARAHLGAWARRRPVVVLWLLLAATPKREHRHEQQELHSQVVSPPRAMFPTICVGATRTRPGRARKTRGLHARAPRRVLVR